MMLCNSIKDLSKINKADFLYELKLDGIRALMHFKDGKIASLVNRGGVNVLNRYPELQNLKISQKTDVVFDGELVVLEPNTFKCDFNSLMSREHTSDSFKQNLLSKKYPVTYFAFDILKANGLDITNMELTDRKEILNAYRLFETENFKVIPFFEHLDLALKVMSHNKSEGIILKKKDSFYSDSRSSDWLKFKKRTEKTIKFNDFENNADGSLTLTDGFHRVKCEKYFADEVKSKIEFDGYAMVEVEGLEFTEKWHIRFPQIRKIY